MEYFFAVEAIAAACFGLILGSFINVLVLRYGTGEGVGGRSHCMHCGHQLSSAELVPIVSYLFLNGRCRSCSARISPQYPLVEGSAVLLSLGSFLLNPNPLSYALSLAMWLTLLFAVVYDLRHSILPPPALIAAGALGLASTFLSCAAAACHLSMPSPWALSAGPLLASPLLFLSAVSRGRWMGWGDGLLELGLGWLIGLSGGFTALCIAFWSGALVGLAMVSVSALKARRMSPVHSPYSATAAERVTMKSEIPFAPFIVFGAAVVYFFHVDIFAIILSH